MSVTLSNTSSKSGDYQQPYILSDNCDTAYIPGSGYGDIGMNIAAHPESHIAGFQDLDHFTDEVERVSEGLNHPSDALIYLMANESQTDDLNELLEVACKAQHPEDYGDGFVHLVDYRSGENTGVVTAGEENAARHALEHSASEYQPRVVGGSLEQQDGEIAAEEYCAGSRKIGRIQDDLGVDFEQDATISFGNSGNDGPMMMASDEAYGWDRTREYSTAYFSEDPEFWSRGAAAIIADKFLQQEGVEEAKEAAFEFLETGQERFGTVELTEIEEGDQEGPVTKEVMNTYTNLRDSREVIL